MGPYSVVSSVKKTFVTRCCLFVSSLKKIPCPQRNLAGASVKKQKHGISLYCFLSALCFARLIGPALSSVSATDYYIFIIIVSPSVHINVHYFPFCQSGRQYARRRKLIKIVSRKIIKLICI